MSKKEDPDVEHFDTWLTGSRVLAEHEGLASLPRPRVHGNGFVQVDLVRDGSRRLHVWGHPATPRQSVRATIHDHVYGLASTVLTGALANVTWIVRPLADASLSLKGTANVFEVYVAGPPDAGGDTALTSTGSLVLAVATSADYVGPASLGDSYVVEPGAFHSTVVDGPTASLMLKVPQGVVAEARPRVLLPVGVVPDGAFRRDAYSPELLWGIVHEVYPKWRELL